LDHFAVGLDGLGFGYDILCAKLKTFHIEVPYLEGRIENDRDIPEARRFLEIDETFLACHSGHILIEDDYFRQLVIGYFVQEGDQFQAVLQTLHFRVRVCLGKYLSKDLPVVQIVVHQYYVLIFQHTDFILVVGIHLRMDIKKAEWAGWDYHRTRLGKFFPAGLL
jgi:hypothetical protein